jgi:outer membrane scaffolding protein for murein synthesis (MipA/OmpV family)
MSNKHFLKHLSGLAALLLAFSNQSYAEEAGLPVWEVGAGIGALSLPHYPGADQSQTLVVPFPLLIYRGETVRAGRGAIRGILYEQDNTRIDISIRGSLPVNSEDNRARQGMDDLDPTLEIGPQIAWTAHQGLKNNVQLRLPARAVISVGSNGIKHQGNVLNPNIRWDHQFTGNFRITARLSARFGDSQWHDYFYAVSAADALVDRPQYNPGGGYSGSSLGTTFSYQHNDWRIGGGMGIEWLDDASFEDSPLVKESRSYFVGFAVSKALWKSERKTQRRLDSDN